MLVKIYEKGLWFYGKSGILGVTDHLLIREERYFNRFVMMVAKYG